MIDIKAIRAAAEAAPQDSWRYESYGQTVWADDTYMVADIRGWGYLQQRPNGAEIQDATGVHIATANPATVLALCDEIERLRKEVERLQAAASDPQLLTSDERRAVGERILMHIKHGTEYVK